MKMNGKFDDIYEAQIKFQERITELNNLPADEPAWYSYHMLALVEEMGEVLKTDKRWKTHRNTAHAPAEKLEEIVDMLITLINICIFSNIGSQELVQAANEKINENNRRLLGE